MRTLLVALAALLVAGPAAAGSRELRYGPAPGWVKPPPEPTAAAAPEGAPVRVGYMDFQVRVGSGSEESYTAYRLKVLTAQALSVGNISVAWDPASDDVTVHRLRILRGGEAIDVLSTAKFRIIQRETNLESAMLSGQLTAVLQAPGLEVGDDIEFAVTVRRRDPTFGPRPHGFIQLPLVGGLGAYRARVLWAEGATPRWRVWPDLAAATPARSGDGRELVYELRDPRSAIVPEGAPPRAQVRRLVQHSSFGSWGELSERVRPLFETASALAPDSPVQAEAQRIARQTSDPAARAEAALRLVQERVRYVYVGLNGGNYRPATADETWTRRFGDCKGKTTLLLALLRELGVAAEPVLVNLQGGDGTDELLPTPAAFDHVLVRATVDGRAYWLDGARAGDRRLADLPAPVFRWALPLRAGAGLEPVRPTPPAAPDRIFVIEQDASAGFAAPAKLRAQQVLRGDLALQMQAGLSALSREDAERALKAFWREQIPGAEPAAAEWRYDEGRKLVALTMSGEQRLEWDGDDQEGRSLQISGAGFTPPGELKRPAEQDQDAPWVVEDFPAFRCWVTIVRLPPATATWKWDYGSRPVNRTLGGVAYLRRAGLDGGVMRTVMSKRTLAPEIDAAEARRVNAALPTFDNRISVVFQTKHPVPPAPGSKMPLLESVDWTSPVTPCGPGGEDPQPR